VAFATMGASGLAAAQAESEAAARELFNEARELAGKGQYAPACPKLEAASKLYRGSGLLITLGDCYEHLGRTASAWTTFGDAASVAAAIGRSDDEAEAKRRQRALEPRLSRLAIHVSNGAEGVTIARDGVSLDAAAWGAPIPVDPGTHTVSARAPGRAPWSSSIAVTQSGQTVTVDVPDIALAALAPALPLGSAPSAKEPDSGHNAGDASLPYWTGLRATGVTIAGAGVIAVGAGGVLGLVAKSRYDSATGETGAAQHDDSVTAVDQANAATWVMGVGAVVAAAGVVVWLTARGPAAAVQTNGREIFFQGSF
jgi:hypothetical protein